MTTIARRTHKTGVRTITPTNRRVVGKVLVALILLVIVLFVVFPLVTRTTTITTSTTTDGDDRGVTLLRTRSHSHSKTITQQLINVDDPYHILPQTLYVVFGLESSGTTLMSDTIAKALKLPVKLRNGHDTVESMSRSIHIQHLSLPMGIEAKQKAAASSKEAASTDDPSQHQSDLPIIDVFLPKRCQVYHDVDIKATTKIRSSDVCRPFVGPTMTSTMLSPSSRYFVNITSHIQWYRDRNVLVFPVLVTRDPYFRFQSFINKHCQNRTQVAIQQYVTGQRLIVESIQALMSASAPGRRRQQSQQVEQPQLVIVSYESLMTIGTTYLTHMVYPQLGIYQHDIGDGSKETASHLSDESKPARMVYTPIIKNGNLKYAAMPTSPSSLASPNHLTTKAFVDHLWQLEQQQQQHQQQQQYDDQTG